MVNMQIANTILEQLGGNRFQTMVGPKDMVAIENGLQFGLKRGFAKNTINKVVIKLNGLDLYDVTFYNIRGINIKEIETETNLYADQLQSVFTKVTGLETLLF